MGIRATGRGSVGIPCPSVQPRRVVPGEPERAALFDVLYTAALVGLGSFGLLVFVAGGDDGFGS